MLRTVCFLILLSTMNVYGSFSIMTFDLSHEAKEIYLSYDDYDLLEKFYLKKISYEEFRDESLKDFDTYLMNALDCESLSDPEILKKCAINLKEKNIQSIQILLPYFALANAQHLHDLAFQFFDEIHSKINNLNIFEIFHEKGVNVSTSNYLLSELSFDTSESAQNVLELASILLAYPENTYDKQGYCDIEVAENTLSFDTSYFIEQDHFNTEKCREILSKYQLMPYNLIDDNSPLSAIRIPAIHPSIQSKINDIITPEIALEIFSNFLTSFFPKGLKTNLFMETIVKNSYYYLSSVLLLNDLKIEHHLDYIANTDPEGKILYDGVNGIHRYQNSEIRSHAAGLMKSLSKSPEKSRQIIIANNMSKIFKDTNTVDEKTRLEPIDLISNLLYREVLRNDFDHTAGANLKNFFKEVLNYTVGLKEDIENPLYVYPREPQHSHPKLLCAYPGISSDEHPLFYHHIEYWPSLDPINSPVTNQTDEFYCKNKKYVHEVKKREEPALKVPTWKGIQDGYVDILLPYSLTSELDDSLTKIAIKYFQSLKYKFTSTPINDVKSYVAEQLLTADVLMPAGHGLASRDLSIGTKEGTLLSFTRKKRKNGKYGIRFHFILPKKNSTHETINIGELSNAYQKRMEQNLSPLFVFVISCSSTNNLFDWSLIYRQAIEPLGQDPELFPFVIASSRGFPTSSSTEIASNIFFPTDVADMLAKGLSPEQIYKDLQTRQYGSIAQEFLKRLGQAWLPIKPLMINDKSKSRFGDIFKEPQNKTFSPEYNFSDKYRDIVLKMAGTRHLLYQGDKLIMDETY